jgi:hypothetical protein
MDGEALAGGMMNVGAVRRRGEVVERPAQAHAGAIHGFLRALAERGFDGAPRPVRLDPERGREEVSFLPGDVAVLPYPRWALADDALRSVGALLRRLHDASDGIEFDPAAGWATDLADPDGGTMLCHNDVCLENVVFRDGVAVGLIDFDLTAPGPPLWDLASTARYWVPMLDPVTAAERGRSAQAAHRLRVLADGYGLDAAGRTALPGFVVRAHDVAREFVAARVAAGDPVFTDAWAERGGWAPWDRIRAWMVAGRAEFVAALTR